MSQSDWTTAYAPIAARLKREGVETTVMPLYHEEEHFDPSGPYRVATLDRRRYWAYRGLAHWYLGTWHPYFYSFPMQTDIASLCSEVSALRRLETLPDDLRMRYGGEPIEDLPPDDIAREPPADPGGGPREGPATHPA